MSLRVLKRFIILCVIVVSSAFCFAAETVKRGDLGWLDQYNVVWDSQSKNSGESMPVSGGPIGSDWYDNLKELAQSQISLKDDLWSLTGFVIG